MSRWAELYKTTPSGKTLFVCRCCGRITPVPDRSCPAPPEVDANKYAIACEMFDEIEAACIAAGDVKPPPHTVLHVGESRAGDMYLSWQTPTGERYGAELLLEAKSSPVFSRAGSRPTFKEKFERTPEGTINNCALAWGEDESTCQVCEGHCPDRKKYK